MRIGITGGIGSGKSYVAQQLHATAGIPIYDCDQRARQLMESDADIRRQLTDLLGSDAYTDSGQLNRPHVAAYLFASTDHAKRIDSIVHPAVRSDFRRWASAEEEAGHRLVAIESALLFEAHLDEDVDAIVLVDAPQSLRQQRAAHRDATTTEAIAKRQQHQTDHAVLRQRAHYIINNDGQPLAPQLTALLQQLSTP